MRFRGIRYGLTFVLILFVGGLLTAKTARAASAEVVLSSDKEEVNVGDVFFTYITIDSEAEFNDFEASIIYDDEILEYQGGASQVSGSSGFLKIADLGVTKEATTRKYTLKFEAMKVGLCKISFNQDEPIMVYEAETGHGMSVSSNILTINVAATVSASSNTKLEALQISPSELIPEFNADIYEYSTEVGYETEQLVIVALPEDKKSKVSIIGNDSLKEGENKVIVSVLAESGANIEYTIKVNRAIAPEETVVENPGLIPDTAHGFFEVSRVEGEKYAVYGGKYKLLEPGNDVEIPEGYRRTKLIISDISITAYYPDGDMESNFLLIYAENEIGEVTFYRYDKIEKTMQRYIPGKDIVLSSNADTDMEDLITSEQYRTNLTKAAVVIALLSALCVLLIIVMLRIFIKMKGYKEEDLD